MYRLAGHFPEPKLTGRRDRKIFDMWMACHTQEEIAEACGCDQDTVSDISSVLRKKFLETESVKEPPIYNVWKKQEKTAGSKHFGNSEVRWVDNLLYLYTQPFAIAVA